MINEKLKAGFVYLVEVLGRDGTVIESEIVPNMMPEQGLNHMLGVTLRGESQVASWYIGLYENAYNPQPTDTAATFPAAAGECTAYEGSSRLLFSPGAVSGGVVDNSGNIAEFTFTSPKTVAGGFISSVNGKGSTSGMLLSAVRFASPKTLETGSILRVTAGLQLVSA